MKIKRWHIWLGVLISAVFLFFAFRKVDFAELWQYLKQAKWAWVLLGLLSYFIGVGIRTWRWQLLLKPVKKVSLQTLFPVVCVGYMGNNIYPARAGEVLRSIMLRQKEDISISGSLATIVVERLFDGITILALVLLNLRRLAGISSDPQFGARMQTLALIAGVLFGVLLLVFLAMAIFPEPTRKVIDWLVDHLVPAKFRDKVKGILDKFVGGLSILRSAPQTLLVLALSFLVWVFEAGLYWGVMKALGLSLSYMDLLLIEGVVNLVLLIPAMPGGLGTFDAATKFMLEQFGASGEQALGYALILRVALWLPITVLGAIYFVKEGFSLSTDINAIQSSYKEKDNTNRVIELDAPDGEELNE